MTEKLSTIQQKKEKEAKRKKENYDNDYSLIFLKFGLDNGVHFKNPVQTAQQ